jgi:hypothetical protein
MEKGTLKTSTIFIAKGGKKTRVYHDESEIPRKLREELEETVCGSNSSTILIIDRRARDEIRKALESLPAVLRTRLALSMGSLSAAPARKQTVSAPVAAAPMHVPAPTWDPRLNWLQRYGVRLAVVGAAMAVTAAYFLTR